MALDAFSSRMGSSQGRLVGAAPGDYAFVLGEAEAGWSYDLTAGDCAEVVQTADLTGATLVRVRLSLTVPKEVPAGLAWEASIVVDGVKRARASCRPGRQRTLTDLAANVSKLTGAHEVGVRLELVPLG